MRPAVAVPRAPRAPRVPLGLLGLLLGPLLGLAAGCGDSPSDAAEGPLVVAGAADLRPAFTILAEEFEEATGEEVTLVFGSSGQLAQQVMEGAPMDVFASANVTFVDDVVEAGRGDPATRATYAHGRVVIWSPEDAWGGWESVEDLAQGETVRALALANPEHAPYGLAARQALEAGGVWDDLEPRLAYGEHVADTQRLAASGNADAAIIALSLALASEEAGEGRWLLIDEGLHEPLRQDLVVVAEDPGRAALAGEFVAYVSSEEGREVMRRFGFLLPDDEPPEAWER